MRQYQKIKIKPAGNRKTDPNVLDTVRGCVGAKVLKGGCYNQCYAAKMARMSGTDFSVPVSMELDEPTLRRALKKVEEPWIRIGVSGDPSLDWDLTVRTCKIIADEGKTPVVITKGWKSPTAEQLESLERAGAVLHVSVSGSDTDAMFDNRTKLMSRYRAHLREEPKIVMRIISSSYTGDMGNRQETYRDFARVLKIPILETPLRMFSNNPFITAGDIDKGRLHKHVSPFTGKEDGALTAGRLFYGDNIGYCDTACKECPNQCWTITSDPRAEI